MDFDTISQEAGNVAKFIVASVSPTQIMPAVVENIQSLDGNFSGFDPAEPRAGIDYGNNIA